MMPMMKKTGSVMNKKKQAQTHKTHKTRTHTTQTNTQHTRTHTRHNACFNFFCCLHRIYPCAYTYVCISYTLLLFFFALTHTRIHSILSANILLLSLHYHYIIIVVFILFFCYRHNNNKTRIITATYTHDCTKHACLWLFKCCEHFYFMCTRCHAKKRS